jgi:hypothetical protein
MEYLIAKSIPQNAFQGLSIYRQGPTHFQRQHVPVSIPLTISSGQSAQCHLTKVDGCYDLESQRSTKL